MYTEDERKQNGLLNDTVEDAVKALKGCKKEAVLVKMDDATQKGMAPAIGKDLEYFFANYNYFLQTKYNFDVPDLDMVVNVYKKDNIKKWKRGYTQKEIQAEDGEEESKKMSAPKISSGMINLYNGYTHLHMAQSPMIVKIYHR